MKTFHRFTYRWSLLMWLLSSTAAPNSTAQLLSFNSTTWQSTETVEVMENEAFVIKPEEFELEEDGDNVSWYNERTNQKITTEEGHRVHSSLEKLWFLPTSIKDTGSYTFIVWNITSELWRQRYQVNVHEFSMGLCYHQKTLYHPNVVNKAAADITCIIAENYRVKGPITWYKDCRPINGQKYFMERTQLVIKDLTRKDKGIYTCQFTHDHDGREFNVTQSRRLQIQAPSATIFPVFATPRNDTIEVELGSSVNIACSAFLGYSKQIADFILWDVNGNEVKASESSRFRVHTKRSLNESYTTAILTITEIRREDLISNFTCFAQNTKGWNKSSVTLIMKVKDFQKHIWMCFIIFKIIILLIILLWKIYRVDVVLMYRDMFQPLRFKDDGKIYDAYVVYARKSHTGVNETDPVEFFVYNILLDVLENKCGYTLYVHGRNPQPGEEISTAADWSISKSRRIILILNSELVENEEFAFEQQIGLYSALVSNNLKVIIIEMDKIVDDSKLQESLKHIIRKSGTIKWESGNSATVKSIKSSFWKHVRYQMPGRKSPAGGTLV
ncbi:interleukin-1 receptor-like 1 [Pleurodeles waltl]|uniref:interleukin-1 receptor-like 1 n=1 Tax=Pleurodeles waltl TaxID=8319 RepID=UPI0037095845